jgi:hypothetical protein
MLKISLKSKGKQNISDKGLNDTIIELLKRVESLEKRISSLEKGGIADGDKKDKGPLRKR